MRQKDLNAWVQSWQVEVNRKGRNCIERRMWAKETNNPNWRGAIPESSFGSGHHKREDALKVKHLDPNWGDTKRTLGWNPDSDDPERDDTFSTRGPCYTSMDENHFGIIQ